MEGHNHGSHPGQTHARWLKYSNQGATRNDPLDPRLIEAMSFLGDMGITMDVVSGGQEAAGQGGSRTGSTRHDHGNAADADFYMGGRKLDWNNPDDLPVLTQIIQTAKARGVTGIGAGDDYMGAGRFHVGFGNPGVWGAGGKSANAPEWLVKAYGGTPVQSVGPGNMPAPPAAYPTSAPPPPNALAAIAPPQQQPVNYLEAMGWKSNEIDPELFINRNRNRNALAAYGV